MVRYKFIFFNIFPELKNNNRTLYKKKNKKNCTGEYRALNQRTWAEDLDLLCPLYQKTFVILHKSLILNLCFHIHKFLMESER